MFMQPCKLFFKKSFSAGKLKLYRASAFTRNLDPALSKLPRESSFKECNDRLPKCEEHSSTSAPEMRHHGHESYGFVDVHAFCYDEPAEYLRSCVNNTVSEGEAIVKKNPSLITSAGVLIYVLLSVTDRFVVSIADHIYIPLAITGIVLALAGIIMTRRTRGAVGASGLARTTCADSCATVAGASYPCGLDEDN